MPDIYGEHSLSLKTCEYWFQWFKHKIFYACDKQHFESQKIANPELEVLLNEDPR